jgi:DNA-binding transcriptional LysR family regulator
MELRHLRAAVAVADHLHFGNAAAALGVAQPPLSQTVKALETELGVTLFDRTTRRVRLTPAGEAFVADARTAISIVDAASGRARAMGRGEAGHLAIGIVGSAVVHPLSTVVRAFRTRYPGVTMRFSELPTMAQLAELRADTLDVGFLRPPLPTPADDIDLLPVLREPLVAVLPADHRLASRQTIATRSLATEPFVCFPRHLGPGLFDEITALCRRAGFDPGIEHEAVQMQTIVGLVASGCGVAIVPASVAGLRRPDVVFPRLSPTSRLVSLALARRTGHESAVVNNFVALTRDVVRDRPPITSD